MTLPSPFFKTEQVPTTPQQKIQFQTKINQKNEQPKEVSQQSNKRSFAAFCKYCQEGFSNDTELFQHRKAHTKCPYDECKFSANEVTIANHIQRAHLKQNALVKIEDLTTPEQIEKWREERRKRYPTTQNVILRQQIQEEKLNRGERLHDSKRRFGDNQQRDFVKNLGKKRNDNNNRGNKFQHRNKRFDRPEKESPKKQLHQNKSELLEDNSKVDNFKRSAPILEVKKLKVSIQEAESSDDEESQKIPKFRGTSSMKEYHTVETIVKEKSALSVLGMYGSDSDEEQDEPKEEQSSNNTEPVISLAENQETHILKSEENPINTQDLNEAENSEMEPDCQEQDDNLNENEQDSDKDDGPEEIPIVKQVENDVQQVHDQSKSRKRKRNEKQKAPKKVIRRSGLDYSKLRNKSINPFLEKLLERDIVHERNVLLQCVNFVVKNNFFGIGQENGTPSSEKS